MDESAHFPDVLRERGIERDWIERAIHEPESVEDRADGTRHFVRRIPEYGQRWLRVVANVETEPPLLVTAFFDRRMRRRHESQGGPEE